MAIYEEFSRVDLIRPVKHHFDSGTFKFGYENTITLQKATSVHSPWKIHKQAPDRKCNLWHDIYFNKYNHMAKGCLDCWKIVVKPQTLKELVQISNLQKTLDMPSKCGIDRRDYTDCLYSGYWYCPLSGGLEEARELYKTIKKEVRKQVHGIDIFLKRGCTEMELRRGPSDTWKFSEGDQQYEQLLDSVLREECEISEGQSELLKVHIFTEWVRWAFKNGDKTWKEFCSVPLARPVVTYHDSNHESQNFVIPDFQEVEVDDKSKLAIL